MNPNCRHLCLNERCSMTGEVEETWHSCRIGQDMVFCSQYCAFASDQPGGVKVRKRGTHGKTDHPSGAVPVLRSRS